MSVPPRIEAAFHYENCLGRGYHVNLGGVGQAILNPDRLGSNHCDSLALFRQRHDRHHSGCDHANDEGGVIFLRAFLCRNHRRHRR